MKIFITRQQYDKLPPSLKLWMIRLSLRKSWSLGGVAVSGTTEQIADIRKAIAEASR